MAATVAILGRPNVGKSTLFNRLIGQRRAIVDDRPGVTRDRNYGEAEFEGQIIRVIDTGGFEPDPDDELFATVRHQAEVAIGEADVLLFVVDRQTGITPADLMTADILRRMLPNNENNRLLLVVNKCDGPKHEAEAAEFWQLGFPELLMISAEHGRGIYELWEHIVARLPEDSDVDGSEEEEDVIRVAILGRPNIGKSTLTNRLIGENRHVVHNSPGTTVDSIDSLIEIDGQKYCFVDTAGIRRRAKIDTFVERVGASYAIRTIERCHITLLMIDGEEGITSQDARLASLIQERGRGCILLINRWDLVQKMPERNSAVVMDEIFMSLPHLSWAPVLYISALTGKGCHRILSTIQKVYTQFDKRIPTAKLNQFLEKAVVQNSPPTKNNHRVRLNYMTQTRVRPPTFAIWGNSPDAVRVSYKRYLENRLRGDFGFLGTPIRIHFRKKRRQWEEKDD